MYENKPWNAKDVGAYEATHEWLVEKIENGRIYIEGAEYPQKGLPSSEVMWSLNILKRMCRYGLRLASVSWLFKREAVFEAFNEMARKIIGPFYLTSEGLSPFGKEFEILLTIFFLELGIANDFKVKGRAHASDLARNLTHILEFDMAYRWRMQDLLSETNSQKLASSREIARLGKLLKERDDPGVWQRTKKIVWLLRGAMLVPKVRWALKTALTAVDFRQLQFDEADRYWCCFRTDYKFFGLSNDDRMRIVAEKGWKVPIAYEIEKKVV